MRPRLKSLRSRSESILVAFIWICIWVFVIVTRIEKTPGGGLFLLKSSQHIRALFGSGDAGALLEVAQTWSSFNGLDPITQYWIVRLWSPGLPIIEIPMLWIEKLGIPIYLTFMAVVLLLWGTAIYLFWRYFSPILGRLICILIGVFTYFSWDFNYFFVEGLFNTEGIAYCFLIISFFGLFYNIVLDINESLKPMVIFGILFGFSIWVRHTNDVTLALSSIIFFLLLISRFLIKAKKNSTKAKSNKKRPPLKDNRHLDLQKICVFLAIALAVTLPWRIAAPTVFGGVPGPMTSGSGVIAGNVWAPPESVSGKYWGVYGSNWACKIDPKQCAQILASIDNAPYSSSQLMFLATKSAILNPLNYLDERLKYAKKFSNPLSPQIFNFGSNGSLFNFGYLFFILYYFRKIPKTERNQIIKIWIPFIVFTIFQLMWIHFESRYFIPLRIGLLGMFVSTLAVHRSAKGDKTPSPNVKTLGYHAHGKNDHII